MATKPAPRPRLDAPHGRVEAAYRAQSVRMWRALLAYSGDPDIASDAVAEAFAQAIRRDGEIRHVEPWVWKAAFRIAAGQLKERSRFVSEIDAPVDDPLPLIELRSALMKVSPKQRASFVLFYYGGYPPREIARLIESTPAAVRVHLFRGRRRLAEILDGGRDD